MAKKKVPVYIGETKLPDALQSSIIARFLKQGELKQFWDRYAEARLRDRSVQPPTKLQCEIAELRKKISANEIAKQKKMSISKVQGAIRKVAVYRFLNS